MVKNAERVRLVSASPTLRLTKYVSLSPRLDRLQRTTALGAPQSPRKLIERKPHRDSGKPTHRAYPRHANSAGSNQRRACSPRGELFDGGVKWIHLLASEVAQRVPFLGRNSVAALIVLHLAPRKEQIRRTDPMNKFLAYFVGCAAVAFLALAPAKASAGWGWWGGPGVSITIGPRYGYYGYGYRPYWNYGYPYGYYRPYGYYGGYYGYRPYWRGHWRRHYRRWH
jgi:hypothetical protein